MMKNNNIAQKNKVKSEFIGDSGPNLNKNNK